MTYPQDPHGQNPFSYDALGRVPEIPPPPPPPVFPPAPALPYEEPVNAFATLSLIFAVAFAPAGAILGQLGLAQIRRTGERGRNRALVGITLSYVVITLTVVGLAAWATLSATSSNKTAAPATASTSGAAPRGPTVAPDAIAALLPGVTDLKSITGDQNLKAGQTWGHPSLSGGDEAIDRPECWGSVAAGAPDAYDGSTGGAAGGSKAEAMSGYQAQEFDDTVSLLNSIRVVQAVAGFRDAPAAEAQLAQLLAGWHQCGGRTVNVTVGGQTVPLSLGAPTDAGNGITTMDLTPRELRVHSVRAIATKANVVVDVFVSYSGTRAEGRTRTSPGQSAEGIATYILGKVPG